MLFLPRLVPTATLLALLALTACRRPGPSLADDHPGVDPKPTGRALQANVPTTDPERPVIDLTRNTSLSQSLDLPAEEDDLVHEAAMRGEAWAQTRVGKSYIAEAENPERLQLGVEFLKRSAVQKDPEALYQLASLAASGLGLPHSEVEAMRYLKEAAELGHPDAQFEFASRLSNSSSSPAAAEEALNWTRRAASQGHAGAQHAAAIMLLRRAATPGDTAEGLALLESAASQNHREALMVLAGILTRGEFGLTKDQARAEALLQPRAEDGDPEFQFGLGTLYLYGDQLPDRKKAGMEWIQRSAEGGHEPSADLLKKMNAERVDSQKDKQPSLFRLGGRVELKIPEVE